MFDDFREPDLAEQLRGAAIAPFAAWLVSLGYLTIYPLLPRVPRALFWTVAVVLFVGAAIGIVSIARLTWRRGRELRDARTIGWLILSAAMALLCARTFVALTFPWL